MANGKVKTLIITSLLLIFFLVIFPKVITLPQHVHIVSGSNHNIPQLLSQKRIVPESNATGGEITVENSTAEAANFTIELPQDIARRGVSSLLKSVWIYKLENSMFL